MKELEISMQKRWQREKKPGASLFFLTKGEKRRKKGTMTSFGVAPTLV